MIYTCDLQEVDSSLRYVMQFSQNCNIVDTNMTAPASEQLRIALTQLADDTLQHAEHYQPRPHHSQVL